MSGLLVFVLVAALLVPTAAAAEHGRKSENLMLRQLLTRKQSDSAVKQETAPAWRARRAHLTEDERELMTKQIMQAISEMMSSDCVTDRDYQGWVDFGRREAE